MNLMTQPQRAACYYRMSDDKQENSIARQRAQVEPYAARQVYIIVKEYEDLGIAGDEEKKRKGFMQMMADAQRGQFAVILCDDRDRWMRADSITSGHYVYQLRNAGVRLETVAQGRIKWDDFASRIIDSVLAESKKLESQANSRRVISRMLLMARQGKWLGGPAPYAYVVTDDPLLGKRLVPGDYRHVRAVQLIFRLYVEHGFSLRMVAAELYERGILNPRGGTCWCPATVGHILRNRKYVGDACWNVGHDGKYSEVAEGAIRTSDSRLAPRARNHKDDWIVVVDAHEAIIEREQFEQAQLRLAGNQKRTTPQKNGGDFLLTGLLICGKCGSRMAGQTHKGHRSYRCGLYHHSGKQGCTCNTIQESKLVSCILTKLQATLLNPKNLTALRQEVERQAEQFEQARPGRALELEKRLEEVKAKIDPAVERLGLIPPDLLPEYGAMVRGLKEERDRLEGELERTQTAQPDTVPDLDATLGKVEELLYQLREAIFKENPVLAREFLRRLISKIELHFEEVPGAKGRKTVFRKGVIYVDTEGAGYAPVANLTDAARRVSLPS
jgi:DNA invertase Pin-like site-specific DNA recombinase